MSIADKWRNFYITAWEEANGMAWNYKCNCQCKNGGKMAEFSHESRIEMQQQFYLWCAAMELKECLKNR